MSIRTFVAAAVAVALTGVFAGEATAQSRGGGHCAGGQSQATMTSTPGSQSSQTQLAQMRNSYNQQLQLAQMRLASLQKMQAAQMQANRAAATAQTAAKQTTTQDSAASTSSR